VTSAAADAAAHPRQTGGGTEPNKPERVNADDPDAIAMIASNLQRCAVARRSLGRSSLPPIFTRSDNSTSSDAWPSMCAR
jgi:hypothetical protein